MTDVALEYMGKYHYEGEYWAPVGDIVPLANDSVYIVFEVPESMSKDETGSILVTFKQRAQEIAYKSPKRTSQSPSDCSCYPFSYTHYSSPFIFSIYSS